MSDTSGDRRGWPTTLMPLSRNVNTLDATSANALSTANCSSSGPGSTVGSANAATLAAQYPWYAERIAASAAASAGSTVTGVVVAGTGVLVEGDGSEEVG